jgi:hypothetical protein
MKNINNKIMNCSSIFAWFVSMFHFTNFTVHSVVIIVTRLSLGRLGHHDLIPGRDKKYFPFLHVCRPAVGSFHPSICWLPTARFAVIRRPGREDHLHLVLRLGQSSGRNAQISATRLPVRLNYLPRPLIFVSPLCGSCCMPSF